MEGKSFKHLLLYMSIGGIVILMAEYTFIFLNLKPEGIDLTKFLHDTDLTGYLTRASVLGIFLMFCIQEAVIKVRVNKRGQNIASKITLVISAIIISALFVYIDKLDYLQDYAVFVYVPLAIASLILIHESAILLGSGLKITDNKIDLSTDGIKKIDKKGAFLIPTVDGVGFPLYNIYRSFLISGGAGSGKTASWYHWLLILGLEQGHSGIVYDFKREFSDYTFNVLKYFNSHLNYKIVDFVDLSRSHRINPLDPDSIINNAYIKEYMTSYMVNLQKDWIKKQDFWAKAVISLVTGATIFLKNNHPEFCTIPHLNEFLLRLSPKQMVNLVKKDIESEAFVAGIEEAVFDKNSGGQVSGVFQTLRDSLAPMCMAEIYWVLTGNDFSLHLNDPKNPTVMCLRSSQGLREQLSPLNALIFTISLKHMMIPDQNESLLYMDEGTTFYIPKIEETPEVARSMGIGLIYGEQDISAQDRVYSKEIRTSIMGAIGNKAFGQTSETDTLKYVTDLFGTHEVIKRNINSGTSDNMSNTNYSSNESYNLKDEKIVKNSDILNLEQGEFYCNLVEGKKKKSLYKGRIKLPKDVNPDYEKFEEKNTVPQFVKGVSEEMVYQNFIKVKNDIDDIKERYF